MSKLLILIQLVKDFYKKFGFLKSLIFIIILFLILIFTLFIIANIFLPFTYIAV